jgi:prepilin-type N-terminal cleavage/methylation domain-containing protein
MAPRPRNRHGFSLIEILVVIGIIALLMAFLLPALEKARENANVARCASNLHQIGLAISLYTNENHGEYPRTLYDPTQPLTAGTAPAATDPFQPGGPAANDVTAAMFLLVRTQNFPTKMFICPYNDVNEWEPDKALNPATRSNFTDYKKNLGYSFAVPYPGKAAEKAGYRLSSHLNPAFPIGADLAPGGKEDNTRNHEDRGQNVLFADYHVDWKQSADVGIIKDDIYKNKAGVPGGLPIDADDTVLVPTQN